MTCATKPIFASAVFAALVLPAHAATPKCKPADELVSAMTKIAQFPDAITDALKLDMVLVVTKEDGSALGERLFYRAPDGAETALPVDADNIMTGAQALAGADARGELCRAAQAAKSAP